MVQNDTLFSISGGNINSSGGLYYSLDNGTTWQNINTTGFTPCRHLISSNSRLIAGTWSDGIIKSDNGGKNWIKTNTPTDFSVLDMIYGNGDTLYVGGNGGVYISVDNGENWTHIGLDIQVFNIAATRNFLFATMNTGIIYSTNKSTLDWDTIESQSIDLPTNPYGLASNGDVILLSEASMGANGIYLSTDAGNNWIKANGMLHFHEIFFGDGFLLSASKDGVYYSSDNGENWLNMGLTNVQSIFVNQDIVFAGTGYDGIWKRPISTLTRTNDIQNRKGISIYPVPANNELTLIIEDIYLGSNFYICDQIGRKRIIGKLDSRKEIINISKLENGLYFIINGDYNNYYVKFIKQ